MQFNPTEILTGQQVSLTQTHDDAIELCILRDQLGQATVNWMEKISKSAFEALNKYREDRTYLGKNIWYGGDLFRACRELKQNKMLGSIKKGNKHLIGYGPVAYFEKIPDNHPIFNARAWHLLARANVLPSAALKAIVVGLSILDCGMACQIARYGALLDVLGKEKFNRLFGSEVGQRINIGVRVHDELQPMRYFTKETEAANSNEVGALGHRPVKKGQLVKIDGVPTYPDKYPFDDGKALITICNNDTPGEQTFIALGMKPKGATESEICLRLLEEYNKKKDPFELAPENDENLKGMKKFAGLFGMTSADYAQKSYPPVTTVLGYDATSPEDFIVELISDLVKLPLEQVSMDFVKTHQVNINRFV